VTISPTAFRETTELLESEISRAIIGQHAIVRDILVALIAGGHVLLEGVPGLGKTSMIRTLASTLDLSFARIQFTPDLMPADITGTNILQESEDGSRQFSFQPGPVFANMVLADEINRATPKTQSALLEAMQEGTATVANTIHQLPHPFFVLATQNPLEMEGTYPLPEAQLDRFLFKLLVKYPTSDELASIISLTSSDQQVPINTVTSGEMIREMGIAARRVPVAGFVTDYIVRLVLATHPDQQLAPGVTRRYVRYGVSPRGAQAIMLGAKVRALLDGRMNVSFEDVRSVMLPALRHRLILNFDAEAAGLSTDDVLLQIADVVPTEGF
jgi:MoxR-like ATPase